ncbi:hypothetical protein [Lichenicoccus sp.]|uniref:hypothetical protein n=1 Tax=Lichenicoccus sp. TaxID=2781899 RepID=UPI003D09C2DA
MTLFSRLATPLVFGAALSLAPTLIGSLPAQAQALRASSANSTAAGMTANRNSLPTPNTTGLPGATASQSISTGTGSPSAVSILGMPLRVSAPVTAPYNGAGSYSTFAGQPQRGQDDVLQQSIDGAP